MDASEYELIDDEWEDLKPITHEKSKSKSLSAAIEHESAYYFRNLNNEVFHKYTLSDEIGDISYITNHLISYVSKKDVLNELPYDALKYKLTNLILLCLKKISFFKKSVTILEIGSTIGENYKLIKELLDEHSIDLKVKFVGIELKNNLKQFSNMLHYDDEDFFTICADASDLSQFPDNYFDICISHTVANVVHYQTQCFAELLRVTKCATVFGMLMFDGKEGDQYYVTADGLTRYLPTKQELDTIWSEFYPLYDYVFHKLPYSGLKSAAGMINPFLNNDNIDGIYYVYRVIAKHPIFPEFEGLCQIRK